MILPRKASTLHNQIHQKILLSGIRFDGDGVGHGCGREAYLGFNVGWSVTGNSELAPKVILNFEFTMQCNAMIYIFDHVNGDLASMLASTLAGL